MFFVASDLSEKQRERLTSCLSIQGMDVTAYTFKKVKVAFEEFFWSQEGSIESRYSILYRTFIFEDCSEEESGYWATDEVTGEKGYVDDKKCFWSWDDNQSTWKSIPFRSRLFKMRKGKRQRICLFTDRIFSS